MDPEEEERIRKRQAGHPVTVEVFMAWKASFEEEMRAIRLAQEGPSSIDKDDKVQLLSVLIYWSVYLYFIAQPTGKQLFLSNRAGLEEALIAAGEQEIGAQLAAAMSAAARDAMMSAGGPGEAGVSVSEDLFLLDEDCDEDLDDLLDDDDDDDDEDYEDDGEEDL